jgi:CheY-like chemotaxis protein
MDDSTSQSTSLPFTAQRVMVVDDNKDTADSLAMLVQVFGHEVKAFYDGPSALANIESYKPTVVLLDIVMPGMDGFALIRAIRQLPVIGSVYAISISGFGRPNEHDRAISSGFDEHLSKPVDIPLLEELLKGRRQR